MVDLAGYLSQGWGKVIITSGNPGWPTTVRVQPFHRYDSVDLLLRRESERDPAASAALADALGDLPLALEIAGAYMEATLTRPGDYLELFKSEFWGSENPGPVVPSNLAAACRLSWLRICQESGAARDLLSLLSYLGPDDIPLILLAGEFRAGALSKGISDLKRYSLISQMDDALFVHPLIQLAIRHSLTPEERKRWAGRAAGLMSYAFPSGVENPESWPKCDRLLSHALVAAERSEVEHSGEAEAAILLNNLGVYLMIRNEQAQAKGALERALALDEEIYGIRNLNVSRDLGNLGGAYELLGDLPAAKAHYERALEIEEDALGSKNALVAVRLNSLGEVLRDMGDLKGAARAFERSLRIDESILGTSSPALASRVNCLGNALDMLGDYAAAEAHYRRALQMEEAAHGLNHPAVAAILDNLGNVAAEQGKIEAARGYYKRALRIFRDSYGDDSLVVAAVKGGLDALPPSGQSGQAGVQGAVSGSGS